MPLTSSVAFKTTINPYFFCYRLRRDVLFKMSRSAIEYVCPAHALTFVENRRIQIDVIGKAKPHVPTVSMGSLWSHLFSNCIIVLPRNSQ